MKIEAFDLETWGVLPEYALQPWRVESRQAWITVAGWTEGKKAYASGYKPDRQLLSDFLQHHAQAGTVLVGANIMFDVTWCLAYGLHAEVEACKWMDFQLLWKRCDAFRDSYSLKKAVALFLPKYAGYEKAVNYGATEGKELAELIHYNKLDCAFTKHMFKMFWKELSEPERKAAVIESKGIPEFASSWLHGLPIDRTYLFELHKEVEKDKLDSLFKLNTQLVEEGYEEVTEEQLSSNDQLGKILFEDWELPVIKATPKGKPSVDKEALIRLAVEYPEVELIRSIRETKGLVSKFITATENSIDYNEDERVHPTPWISGTYTGRCTYSSKQGKNKDERQIGIALHQMKRGPKYRRQVVPPDKHLMGEADWSGQEMRIMADRVAALTCDTTMADLFVEGKDLHSYMGAGLISVDYDWMMKNKEVNNKAKQGRYLGKFANLSLQFRVGYDTMRVKALTDYGLWLTHDEAVHTKSVYLSMYPGVPVYWSAAIALAKRQGYAATMGNRYVALDNLGDYGQQQTAINTPIQGTGADMKQLGIAVIAPVLKKMKILYAFDLHDALFFWIPDNSSAKDNLLDIRHRLANLPYEKAWGWVPRLPLPVDCTLGERWGDLREVK